MLNYGMLIITSSLFGIIFIVPLIILGFPLRFTIDEKRRLNVARLLSTLIPGIGHIYMGHWIRGIIFFLLWGMFAISSIGKLFKLTIGIWSTEYFFAEIIMIPLVLWLLALIGLSGWRKSKPNSNNQEKSL